jgi:hypothetical protein
MKRRSDPRARGITRLRKAENLRKPGFRQGQLQHDGRTDKPGRPHKQSAPAGHEAIREAKMRSALARAIEDLQLMFDENGLGNYGTDAARTRKSRDGGEEMDEKDQEIAHFRILARNRKLAEFRAN